MKTYLVAGLMSGTSLDGLDIALVSFSKPVGWQYNVIKTASIPYDDFMKKSLTEAIALDGLELKKLDLYYGDWLGEQVNSFLKKSHEKPELIVSHGHTIFHQPAKGLTLQIGDGYRIMKKTGIKTINDLRSLDVALGGQGAPLVPVGDKLLFHQFPICLNLGGFSNISYDEIDSRIAYDICPVNTVLNYLAGQMGLPYDDSGNIARSGKVITTLLDKLNSLEYYHLPPPKSLGIEWVNTAIIPLLNDHPTADLLHTFSRHIAQQTGWSFAKVKKKVPEISRVLVTGGGARNEFLIDMLQKECAGVAEIVLPDNQTIDFKEAIIFAFLGLLRMLGQNNTLKSVTGASSDSSGGMIYDHITSV